MSAIIAFGFLTISAGFHRATFFVMAFGSVNKQPGAKPELPDHMVSFFYQAKVGG